MTNLIRPCDRKMSMVRGNCLAFTHFSHIFILQMTESEDIMNDLDSF